MAIAQRRSPRRASAILKEGFLLPACDDVRLFLPTFLVAVAYTAISVHGYSAAVGPLLTHVFHHAEDLWGSNPAWHGHDELVRDTWELAGKLVAAGAAYVLVTVFTVGPAVSAATVSAAVALCSGERSASSSHPLAAGKQPAAAGGRGVMGPFRTAVLCGALHVVACRGAIFVWAFYVSFHLRHMSPVVLTVEFLFFLLCHLFALYVELVCTVAIVVAAAEPAGCFQGARALRQAWWLVAERTRPAVVLVIVKGAVTAVAETVSFYPVRFYHGMACSVLAGLVYVAFYAALQTWFVCATTLYYYQCRQGNGGYDII